MIGLDTNVVVRFLVTGLRERQYLAARARLLSISLRVTCRQALWSAPSRL